ncbi:toxin-antitoxin system, toxin component, RelE family [Klebsiella pneumoniae]|nr:toxin-antitoxin system, toxin component, RelE family [Klebsiella pneumoniae]
MVWTINYSDRALKSLRKMDKQNARRIVDFMDLRIAVAADPRQSGKPLKGELGEFWRYRVEIIAFCVRSGMTSWLSLPPPLAIAAKFTTEARYAGFF